MESTYLVKGRIRRDSIYLSLAFHLIKGSPAFDCLSVRCRRFLPNQQRAVGAAVFLFLCLPVKDYFIIFLLY